MKLSNDVLRSMTIKKIFKEENKRINSIDISSDGETLVTSSIDESINIFNCFTGESRNKIMCKKYGVNLVKFPYSSNDYVLHASYNGWDETIRYLNLNQSAYIRYFKGHKSKVICISVSPQEEYFLSSSLDDTIRFWDSRIPEVQGLLRESKAFTAFDPLSQVFAVATDYNMIKMFDVRNYDSGPFYTWKVKSSRTKYNWCGVSMSRDGKYVLGTSLDNSFVVIDAFTGDVIQEIKNDKTKNFDSPATFSPNGNHVLKGLKDGTIKVWETSTGKEIDVWIGGHEDPVTSVIFNSKVLMVGSVSKELSLWHPDLKKNF